MEQAIKRQGWGISSSTLKIIAVVSMIIDHVAAGILGRYMMSIMLSSVDAGNMEAAMQFTEHWLFRTIGIMHTIGRIAFPIYCFLLVEGFGYTKNRIKYAQRLLLFSVVSEIPFDLFSYGEILETSHQNVFFTLFCGVAVMMGLSWIDEHLAEKGKAIMIISGLAVLAAGAGTAHFLRTDYGATGVLCIAVLYIFRKKKIWQVLAGCVSFLWEVPALLGFVPIWFYNGQRGLKLKYFFYFFYPVHLLVFYLVYVALGLNGYPPM